MCTRARLVQTDRTSAWFGMPHRGAPLPAVNFTLLAATPAYLEVSVDPAAHGEAGLGPIQRGVRLTTAGGQELPFTLTAHVVR